MILKGSRSWCPDINFIGSAILWFKDELRPIYHLELQFVHFVRYYFGDLCSKNSNSEWSCKSASIAKQAQKPRNCIKMAIEKAFCSENERCSAIVFFELVFFCLLFLTRKKVNAQLARSEAKKKVYGFKKKIKKPYIQSPL